MNNNRRFGVGCSRPKFKYETQRTKASFITSAFLGKLWVNKGECHEFLYESRICL